MIVKRFFLFFFFLNLFLIFLLPPTDPDLGWHLRCGQEILNKQSFCRQNNFSVLLENYFWPNHHWLYQAIVWPIFEKFNLWGLTILNALLLTFAFFFFYQSLDGEFLFKSLSIFLIIFFSWGVFSFGIRSQLLGLFFFCLLLFLGKKFQKNPLFLIFIPFVFLFWANTHGGSVILGLIFLLFIFLNSLFFQTFSLTLLFLLLAIFFF